MTVQADPHLSMVRPVTPRTPQGCEECLRNGSPWVHLNWRWCFVHEAVV